jgi:hypothetical protein
LLFGVILSHCEDPTDYWIDTQNWVYVPVGAYNTNPFPNPQGWGPANYTLKSFNPGFDDGFELVLPTRSQINFPELDGRYCHPFDYSFTAVLIFIILLSCFFLFSALVFLLVVFLTFLFPIFLTW